MSFGLHFVTTTPWDWISTAIVFGGGVAMALPDYWRFRKSERLKVVSRVKATLTERGDFKNIFANIISCWIIFFVGYYIMRFMWQLLVKAAFVINKFATVRLIRSWWPHVVDWARPRFGRTGGVRLLDYLWKHLIADAKPFQFGLKIALGGATVYAISFGLVFWFRGVGRSPRSDIRTAEKVTLTGLVAGFSFIRGSIAGLLAGAVLGIVPAILLGWGHGVFGKSEHHIASAGQFWPIAPLIGLIVGGVTANLRKVSVVEKTYPNHGLWLSLRNTLLIWLVVGSVASLVIWGYAILAIGSATATLQDALFLGSVVGMLVGFGYGGLDFLYHLTLRCILALEGLAPFRQYVPFLDNVTHLGFLRRMGGGYMFLHGSLRDIFRLAPLIKAGERSRAHRKTKIS
jgi:hypothetical protein